MAMYKGSLELCKINKGMKLRFNLILKSDDNNFTNQLIRKFRLNGTDYLKLNPHPYLTIDISGNFDKNEEWSSNRVVNLNKKGIFNMILGVGEMIDKFRIPNLYYYGENNRLYVRQEIASKQASIVNCGSGKMCKLQHTVIHDEENQEIEYEGVIFMINHPDNFCYLSFDELKFLRYELQKVNLNQLSLLLINSALLLDKMQTESIELKKVPLQEKEEEELDTSIRFVPIEDPNTIPDL